VAHFKSPAAKDMATISDRAISVPFIFQFPAAILQGILFPFKCQLAQV
jgi:hypothetical protein